MNFKKIRPLHVGEKIVDKDGGVMQGFNLLWQQLFGNGDFVVAELDGKVSADTEVIAGAGLTGGGDLDTDVTLNVGAGTGIAVNANDVAIDTVSEAERIRDVIGTALTDSSTIDFTPNDGADTITASVIAGSIGSVELAASGVVAGTYGDSTHVAQFAVDADGRVTSVTNVGITGASGSGGYRPMVDGSNPPVFIINDDNDLIMTEI